MAALLRGQRVEGSLCTQRVLSTQLSAESQSSNDGDAHGSHLLPSKGPLAAVKEEESSSKTLREALLVVGSRWVPGWES